MKNLLLTGLACASFALLSTEAFAHGGQYRGPGDTVPPPSGGGGGTTPGPGGPTTPGGGGPSTPGAGGPSTPSAGGPSTGGPSAGGGGGGGPTTGGGMQLGDDLTRWQFWWEFNKDPFIKLREAIHQGGVTTNSDDFFMGAGKVVESKNTMRPTDAQIMNEILPKLKQALDSTDQRDITSSCMVAMAKVGRDHEQFKILDVFKERLVSKDLEIRQTAAVAMGISQMTESVDDLIAIATDSPKGQKLTKRTEVDDQTRSFAAYGLGLVGFATSNVDVKKKVLDGLKGILSDKNISDRNIRVAAINAIGILQPTDDDAGRALLRESYDTLFKYWNRKVGPGEQLIQAHVPPAIAKLLKSCDDEKIRAEFTEEMLKTLKGKTKIKRSVDQVPMSAALALGQIGTVEDKAVSKGLLEYYKKGKNLQARYFCLIALGQIGGDENRDELLKVLQKGSKALIKPWAALSLGVLSFNRLENDLGVDAEVGLAMQKWLSKLKNPEALAALAIGLGLAKYEDAADELREMLEKQKNKDELAGYICIGLALMDDQRSTEPISRVVQASVRRPDRLRQAAIALGKLGDQRVAPMLADMLDDDSKNLARMSAIASALGFIGDTRTVSPLCKMLFDEGLGDLTRAFAAVALGGVADKEMLPWNSKIGINMNYRAAVETLTNQQSGILDIL